MQDSSTPACLTAQTYKACSGPTRTPCISAAALIIVRVKEVTSHTNRSDTPFDADCPTALSCITASRLGGFSRRLLTAAIFSAITDGSPSYFRAILPYPLPSMHRGLHRELVRAPA